MYVIPLDPTKPLTAQVRRWGIEKAGSNTGTCVYIFTAADLRVLYVGEAASIPGRWQAHKNRAAWWSQVVQVRISAPLRSRARAESIERQLIRRYTPEGNKRSVVDAVGRAVRFTEPSLHEAVSRAWNLHDLRTESSLWDQGAWIREHGSGISTHFIHEPHLERARMDGGSAASIGGGL